MKPMEVDIRKFSERGDRKFQIIDIRNVSRQHELPYRYLEGSEWFYMFEIEDESKIGLKFTNGNEFYVGDILNVEKYNFFMRRLGSAGEKLAVYNKQIKSETRMGLHDEVEECVVI